MPNSVVSWWVFLCAVAAINVIAWLIAATTQERRLVAVDADIIAFRRLQLCWKHEVVWMSLYFSVGVQVSISLILVAPPALGSRASAPGAP